MLSVHTKPEEFENGVFTLKTHQIFSLHTTPEEFENNNHRSFWICVGGKLVLGNHVIIVTSSFSKGSVFKMFSVHAKTKSQRFQIPSL